MTNLLGRKLGKYEVVERLASGGMGEVYKAFQPGVERYVAIKVMHPHLAGTGDFVQRFQREARSIGRLLHPHILSLIDFDSEGGLYYMVLEYIPGGTLRSYLNNQKQLPVEEALRITGQLADALAYAHQQGMIHRDIKPGNVMFVDESRQHAVLTDFGIARLVNQGDMGLTQPGALFGTPSYMSPEAMRGEALDGRSDIYSLGVLLYEMVTGQRPYVAETPYSLLMKMSTQPLPPPRKLNPSLPQGVQQVLYKALAQEPAKRFQSAAEFGTAVKQLEADILRRASRQGVFRKPTVSIAAPAPSPKGTVVQAPARNRGWFAWATAAVALILVAAVGLFAFRNLDQLTLPAIFPTSAATQIAQTLPTNTVAATSAPATLTATTASPTASPSPTVENASNGSTPTATPLVSSATTTLRPLPRLPQPFGVLRLHTSDAPRTDRFTLDLAPLKRPPAGSHYELWLRNGDQPPLNLGALTVEQGETLLEGSSQEDLLPRYTEALITIENDNDPTTMADSILFASPWPAAYANALRQLLVDSDVNSLGLLPGVMAQSQLALAQSERLQSALTDTDLTAVHQAAEAIVNLLAGQQSSDYGDKDGDGQTQDPGNGFGIQPYLSAAYEQLTLAGGSAPTTEMRTYCAQAALIVEETLAVARSATTLALQIAALPTVAAAQPVAVELQQLLTRLHNGVDENAKGASGITAADRLTRQMAQYPFFEKAPVVGAGAIDPAAWAALPQEVGSFRLADDAALAAAGTDVDQTNAFRFTLALAAVAEPPSGHHYALWLADDALRTPVKLGALTVRNGYVHLTGKLTQNPFAHADSIVISLEADHDPEAKAVGEIVYRSQDHTAFHSTLRQLLSVTPDGQQGLLLGMRDQLFQAIRQVELMQAALQANDLEQVRQQAEVLIHTLDGQESYGDLDGDGQLPMLDNPVSIREYLDLARAQTTRTLTLPGVTERTRAYATLALATYDRSLDFVRRAAAKRRQLFVADTIAEMQPVVNELAQSLVIARDGDDHDGNGVIDPLDKEGAILSLFTLVARMGEYTIYRQTP